MIDIHNHLIPHIDDGADDLDRAFSMLQQAVSQGITHIVCTPHINPGRFDNTKDCIRPAFSLLNTAVKKAGFPVHLGMAAEVRLTDELPGQLHHQQVPFIGQWRGKSAVLLELPHGKIPAGIEKLLQWLNHLSIQVVIPHPERNKEIMACPDYAESLAEKGVLFQLTAGSLVGHFGSVAQETAHWMLKRGLFTFMASDAHHTERRVFALQSGRDAVAECYGETLARKLTWDNPCQLTAALFDVAPVQDRNIPFLQKQPVL
ncbi:Tyrosine-protein phosphatase YwqE [invertebrate metagenome]|uniref:Tyrosine-protein phosphatase YwqE n=1 Tax=invertebrate metagenome TaxID=1711999 RepID=A0A2H9T9N5_9ZZZZ